jgi:hypothetical protein
MALTWTDEGRRDRLDRTTLSYGALYKLPTTGVPTPTDVISTYTVANFSGYSTDAPTLFYSTSPVSNSAMRQTATSIFLHNGGGTANDIYGMYFNNSSWIQGAAILKPGTPPKVMSASGDLISHKLKLWFSDDPSGKTYLIPNVQENSMLDSMIGNYSMTVWLFTSNVTVSASSVWSNFSAITISGYQPSFPTAAVTDINGKAYKMSDNMTWLQPNTLGSPRYVYGYVCKAYGADVLLGGENFGQVSFYQAGDQISFALKAYLWSLV